MNRRDALKTLAVLPAVAAGMEQVCMNRGHHNLDPSTNLCRDCNMTKRELLLYRKVIRIAACKRDGKQWRRITLYVQKDGKWVPLPEKALWNRSLKA